MSILVQHSAKLRVNMGRYEIMFECQSVVWPCMQVFNVLIKKAHSYNFSSVLKEALVWSPKRTVH